MNAVATTAEDARVPATLGAWLLPESPRLSEGIERAASAPGTSGPVASAQETGAPGTTAPSTSAQATSTRWSAIEQKLRAVVVAAILDHLRQAFPDELVTVLGKALATHDKLKAAARSTLLDPTSTDDVGVGHYQVRATHPVLVDVDAPFIELKVPFQLIVEFVLVDAHVHVARGCITEISLTNPSMLGQVTAYGEQVFSQHGDLRLGGTVVLDQPVQVLSDDEIRALGGPTAT